jgi:uncharacterized repeat protein (TIGR02543 family)
MADSSCTLTAPANPGFTFQNWTVGGSSVSTANPYTFTVTENRAVVANFQAITYNITYNLNNGTGTMTPTTYTAATPTITLPTPTRTDYYFGGWYDNAGLTGTAIPTIPTGSTGNKEYWAKWDTAISQYTLSVSAGAGGTASSNPSTPQVNGGTSVTLTATPNSGYQFVSWTENSTIISTAPTYTFTIISNRAFTANFKIAGIPTIIFTPSSGSTLTEADVINKLAEYGLTKADAFEAIINVATTIVPNAFANSGILSVASEFVNNIGNNCFEGCTDLDIIQLPLIKSIGNSAFQGCTGLKKVNLGTALTEPSVILGTNVFNGASTTNADLTVGKNVLPTPNIAAKTWGGNGGAGYYTWKSINHCNCHNK